MNIADFLEPSCVRCDFAADTKKDLLQMIAAAMAPYLGIETQTVFQTLQQRERLGTTGLGQGIAIPHARLEGLTKIRGLFVRLKDPVGFEAIDSQPVDLVFALFAPADAGADHLEALAQVSRLLRSPDVVSALRRVSDPRLAHALLIRTEQQAAA